MIFNKTVVRMYPAIVLLAGLAAAAPPPGIAAKQSAGSVGGLGCPQVSPGSTIRVRLLQTIDSKKSKVGETFKATLVDPLLTRGKVIAERGSTAEVRLIRLLQQEGSSAPPFLGLQLDSLTMRGSACAVVTGFAKVSSGILKVTRGDVPEGTTSATVVLDALTEDQPLGPTAVDIVHGAGVSLAVISGQRVLVPKGVSLHFEVADLLDLGPKTTY